MLWKWITWFALAFLAMPTVYANTPLKKDHLIRFRSDQSLESGFLYFLGSEFGIKEFVDPTLIVGGKLPVVAMTPMPTSCGGFTPLSRGPSAPSCMFPGNSFTITIPPGVKFTPTEYDIRVGSNVAANQPTIWKLMCIRGTQEIEIHRMSTTTLVAGGSMKKGNYVLSPAVTAPCDQFRLEVEQLFGTTARIDVSSGSVPVEVATFFEMYGDARIQNPSQFFTFNDVTGKTCVEQCKVKFVNYSPTNLPVTLTPICLGSAVLSNCGKVTPFCKSSYRFDSTTNDCNSAPDTPPVCSFVAVDVKNVCCRCGANQCTYGPEEFSPICTCSKNRGELTQRKRKLLHSRIEVSMTSVCPPTIVVGGGSTTEICALTCTISGPEPSISLSSSHSHSIILDSVSLTHSPTSTLSSSHDDSVTLDSVTLTHSPSVLRDAEVPSFEPSLSESISMGEIVSFSNSRFARVLSISKEGSVSHSLTGTRSNEVPSTSRTRSDTFLLLRTPTVSITSDLTLDPFPSLSFTKSIKPPTKSVSDERQHLTESVTPELSPSRRTKTLSKSPTDSNTVEVNFVNDTWTLTQSLTETGGSDSRVTLTAPTMTSSFSRSPENSDSHSPSITLDPVSRSKSKSQTLTSDISGESTATITFTKSARATRSKSGVATKTSPPSRSASYSTNVKLSVGLKSVDGRTDVKLTDAFLRDETLLPRVELFITVTGDALRFDYVSKNFLSFLKQRNGPMIDANRWEQLIPVGLMKQRMSGGDSEFVVHFGEVEDFVLSLDMIVMLNFPSDAMVSGRLWYTEYPLNFTIFSEPPSTFNEATRQITKVSAGIGMATSLVGGGLSDVGNIQGSILLGSFGCANPAQRHSAKSNGWILSPWAPLVWGGKWRGPMCSILNAVTVSVFFLVQFGILHLVERLSKKPDDDDPQALPEYPLRAKYHFPDFVIICAMMLFPGAINFGVESIFDPPVAGAQAFGISVIIVYTTTIIFFFRWFYNRKAFAERMEFKVYKTDNPIARFVFFRGGWYPMVIRDQYGSIFNEYAPHGFTFHIVRFAYLFIVSAITAVHSEDVATCHTQMLVTLAVHSIYTLISFIKRPRRSDLMNLLNNSLLLIQGLVLLMEIIHADGVKWDGIVPMLTVVQTFLTLIKALFMLILFLYERLVQKQTHLFAFKQDNRNFTSEEMVTLQKRLFGVEKSPDEKASIFEEGFLAEKLPEADVTMVSPHHHHRRALMSEEMSKMLDSAEAIPVCPVTEDDLDTIMHAHSQIPSSNMFEQQTPSSNTANKRNPSTVVRVSSRAPRLVVRRPLKFAPIEKQRLITDDNVKESSSSGADDLASGDDEDDTINIDDL